MTQQPGPVPPDGSKTYFGHVSCHDGTWRIWTTEASYPLASLADRVVNIGDKDGCVYEAVTVTACDERTGELAVTGGSFGRRFRDTEAAPFEGTRTIAARDIARGYVHPGQPQEEPCRD